MTDPNAHYDDLTEASYVEAEARALAFNEDEVRVDLNIAARKRELRTLLDRLTPGIDDSRELRRHQENADAPMWVALVDVQTNIINLRASLTKVHQLLGDD